ncbi:MAG: hypothetical protein HY054_07635 [Proteobacteria bacterium]|nr:hypothetical protein [Pseudomonadota bacterium]
MNAGALSLKCSERLGNSGVRTVARVAEHNTTDLALALFPAQLAVIRCVNRASTSDHSDIATMVTDGDFAWAGLVYGEREGSETVGLVETFHVSELDRLAARLLELREVFGEAG